MCDNIVFAFDVSGSMNSNGRMTKAKDALKAWLNENVPDGTYIGFVPFNSYANIAGGFPLTEIGNSTLPYVESVIDRLQAGGGTCIGAGINAAIQEPTLFDNFDGGIIVLVGDGSYGCDGGSTSIGRVLDLCLRTKKTVYALNVGGSLDSSVNQIISATGGDIFDVPDTLDVDELNEILKNVCNDDLTTSAPPTTTFSTLSTTISSTLPSTTLTTAIPTTLPATTPTMIPTTEYYDVTVQNPDILTTVTEFDNVNDTFVTETLKVQV